MSSISGILLRRAERRDLDQIIEWLEDPAFLGFLHGDQARAPSQLRERLVAFISSAAQPLMAGGGFYIVDTREHGPVGLVAYQSVSWRNRNCKLDLHLVSRVETLGLADTCMTEALRYAFEEMNLHRVTREVPASDKQALRFLEGMGARREAVLRKHVVRNGAPEDVYSYGLLRSEFCAGPAPAISLAGA